MFHRNRDTTSANEFLWAAVNLNLVVKDARTRFSTPTLIFSSTTNKMTSQWNEQNALQIQWTRRIAGTTKRSKLSHSSSRETKTTKETEETQIAVAAATETVKDTQTAAAKVITLVNRRLISWWRRLDRKWKTRRSSGRTCPTPHATAMNSQLRAIPTAVGTVKPSTGERF
jgi:hypothetical protein